MLRHERRLLIDCLGIGLALALLVIAIDVSGALTPMENYLYDARALLCQFFTKPPTDKLVHLDIDDAAIEVIGRYPWPRAKIAQIIEEVGRAEPKAIELDILLSEPQPVEYVPVIATSRPTETATTTPAHAEPATRPSEFKMVDNDAELAWEIRKLGNVIVPAELETVPRRSASYLAMVEELSQDLEQRENTLATRLHDREIEFDPLTFSDTYIIARREAIGRRLGGVRTDPSVGFDEIRAELLPRTPINVNSGVVVVLREELEKFRANAAFKRFSFSAPPAMAPTANMHMQIAPIRLLSDSASAGAYVNYIKFGSPVIRTIPLLLQQDGRVYPQMGLAIACRMLDADMEHMRIEKNQLVIPVPSKPDLTIPMAPPRVNTDGFVMGNLMDIPWFGGRNWETMYDWPAHKTKAQHIPMTDVWQTCIARQNVIHNNAQLDEAIRGVYWATNDRASIDRYNAHIPPSEDFISREKIARQVIEDWKPFLPAYRAMKASEMTEKDKVFVVSYDSIQQMLDLTPSLIKELAGQRQLLTSKMTGRAVLIGWAATSAIADFIPTSLHEKCPGAVVHGVVFNGIMTGELWTRSPWWMAGLISFALAMLTALTVGYFPPFRALLVAAGLMLSYVFINGIVLFDYGNYIVGAAGPLAAIGIVWGGCTLTRVVLEATERKRITDRFSTYASSRFVDRLLEVPDMRFDGENREMTVIFTDLAGFTSLSERLGERIVPVLNELLGELVPVIETKHEGHINKFIGDGIMFFFNAPLPQHDHAHRGVATVLDMHRRVGEFNVRLRERGLPELSMRGGIASGTVVVGDAGGGGRSDYTCLGDAVNLSSRLEGANKATGTHTLINDRAAELLDGQFLIRPIGKIQAVGKEAAIMCYEPLAKSADASDRERELAALTTKMVGAFIGREFAACLSFADELDAKFGVSKLAKLYRSMSQRYISDAAPGDFDGRIVLTEK